jgi:hypothetical protein
MKKLLYLLLLIPFGLNAQTETVNPGASANDHTGDPLRTAFIKVNTNFAAVRDSFGNIYRESQVDAIIANDVQLNIVGFVKTDTTTVLATKTDLLGISGGSGVTGKFYYLKGRVDVTDGLPNDGDSVLIHTNFIGKHVTVIREGKIQQQNVDNTKTDGYWFDNVTGKITFRPVLSANEQLEIWSTNTILWEALIAEGGDGEPPPTTPLIDSLLAYYALDETSGVIINDYFGVNNGTTTATVNQTGKLGKSELFNGTTYATIPNSASLLPGKDEMTFGCWFYLTSLPSTAGHYCYLARFRHGTAPYYMASIYLPTTNSIEFDVANIAGTEFGYETATSAVSVGQWYYVACVNEGNGVDAKIYLGTSATNIVDVTSYHPTVFSGDLLQFNSVISIGNHSSGSALGVVGYIDEVMYQDIALTLSQIKETAAKTCPF